MPLNRTQRHRQSIIASYKAGKAKPPTRKQAQAWLAPIRNALAELRSGSVDAIRVPSEDKEIEVPDEN